MASINVQVPNYFNNRNKTAATLRIYIRAINLEIQGGYTEATKLRNRLAELLKSDKNLGLPSFQTKILGNTSGRKSLNDYLHQAQTVNQQLIVCNRLYHDALKAIDALTELKYETVADFSSSSSSSSSASSAAHEANTVNSILATKLEELKKTRHLFPDAQKKIVVDMCKETSVDCTFNFMRKFGGNWASLRKTQLETWLYRSDNPKRLPGPKVHLEFERDILRKVMLTVVQDSVGVGAKPVQKIVVSVLYNYHIIRIAAKETQREWKVVNCFDIYLVIC